VKRLNARRVKIHRNYTVDDVARLFNVHKNTVRNWIRSGLPTIDDRRPNLILGRELVGFLHSRRSQTRQRCGPGQLYCVRCRSPQRPAGRRADYIPISSSSGNLRGLCPDCLGPMYRLVSVSKLVAVAGDLDIQGTLGWPTIKDTSYPCLNNDLDEVG
jgi:hypothetical protein